MTVETTTNTATHLSNGVATEFPFNFLVFEATDLEVRTQDLSTDVVVVIPPGSYTIDGLGEPAGSVTFNSAPVDGLRVIIQRIVPYKQPLDIVNQSGFFPDTLERQLDETVMQIQQLAEITDRAITVPVGEEGVSLPNASNRANKFLVFQPDGSLGVSEGTGADLGLREDLGGNSGGNFVAWLRSATGAVKRTLTSKLFGYVDVEDFGAVGNGLVNDTVAWTRGIDFVKTRGLKLRAMSPAYLVSTLVFDGEGYEIATTAGNLFKQTPGLTGDGGVHPIWLISGDRIKFGDASFEGNIDTDVDEYSHAVAFFSVKDVETGVLHGKNIRGDVAYVYGRISSEAEITRGLKIGGLTGDNILRCILAVAGGQGRCGDIHRVGSMRVGYKDIDFEPNLVTGTVNDYQNVNFTVGYVWGATIQCVSADPDVQNYRIKLDGFDLDGSRILNSDPPYGAHAGVNDFALAVDDVMSFDAGDMRIANYQYSPIKLGKKLGAFSYSSLVFENCAIAGSPTDPYGSIIFHLGTDPVGIIKPGITKGTLFNNTRKVFFGAGMPLNLDGGYFDITGGLFGAYVTGFVGGIKLDCGNANGEIAFNVCRGLRAGQTVVTNSALTIGFNECDGMIVENWTATFGTLDYTSSSASIVAINSAINGSTPDGINILTGGNFRILDKVVAGPEGAAISNVSVAAGATPTKAEFDAVVGALNAVLAQRRLGTTRQAT